MRLYVVSRRCGLDDCQLIESSTIKMDSAWQCDKTTNMFRSSRKTATTRRLKSKQSQASNRISARNLLIDFDYDAAFCTEQNTNEQLNSIAGHGQKSHSESKYNLNCADSRNGNEICTWNSNSISFVNNKTFGVLDLVGLSLLLRWRYATV